MVCQFDVHLLYEQTFYFFNSILFVVKGINIFLQVLYLWNTLKYSNQKRIDFFFMLLVPEKWLFWDWSLRLRYRSQFFGTDPLETGSYVQHFKNKTYLTLTINHYCCTKFGLVTHSYILQITDLNIIIYNIFDQKTYKILIHGFNYVHGSIIFN